MRVYHGVGAWSADRGAAQTVVAIGKFDGVHLGHRAILASLLQQANIAAAEPVVLTFSNHPLSVLRPEECPAAVMSVAQRCEAFERAGVAACVLVEFDTPFSQISAEDFVTQILVARLGATHVVLGNDFRFGFGGRGDVALLRELGEHYGFGVTVVQGIADSSGEVVSSSRVREALLRGDVRAAGAMLGRAPVVRGTVVRGDARGREIGFPTANLGGDIEGLVPADGVYAGWVRIADGPHVGEYVAAISVGNNPTFTPDAVSRVEAFVLDFDGDLYGCGIVIEFVERLRDMERFESLEALLDEMNRDVLRTREVLGRSR